METDRASEDGKFNLSTVYLEGARFNLFTGNQTLEDREQSLTSEDGKFNLSTVYLEGARFNLFTGNQTLEDREQSFKYFWDIQGQSRDLLDRAYTEFEFEVGSEPLDGLIPHTFNEIKQLDLTDNLVTLRRRLRAIYWFYNEPMLELDSDASINAC
ncbi:hypothetical protein OROMI_026138 [Orobanche minor]